MRPRLFAVAVAVAVILVFAAACGSAQKADAALDRLEARQSEIEAKMAKLEQLLAIIAANEKALALLLRGHNNQLDEWEKWIRQRQREK